MCADRSGSGCPAQPGLLNLVRSKGIRPVERPRSCGREPFPQATGATVLRLTEDCSASALPVGARRRNKPSTASAKVLPAERRREKQGNVLEGPKIRLRPAWTAQLQNQT